MAITLRRDPSRPVPIPFSAVFGRARRGEREGRDKNHKKNMDKSDHCLTSTHRSAPLRGQEDSSPIPTQCVASVPASGVVGNAIISQQTRGGKSVNLPPSGTARTQQSAAATAPAASLEVTPIPAPCRAQNLDFLARFTPKVQILESEKLPADML